MRPAPMMPGEADDFARAHFERDVDRRLPAGARVFGPEAGVLEAQHRAAEFAAAAG